MFDISVIYADSVAAGLRIHGTVHRDHHIMFTLLPANATLTTTIIRKKRALTP